MLAHFKAASQRHADEVAPLLAAAEELGLRAASLDLVAAFNCVHHFDLGPFLAAAARVLAPGGQLFIYTRTPQQNARTIWGRYFPGFTEHGAGTLTARTRSATPSGGPAGSPWPPHRPSTTRAPAQPGGSGPGQRPALLDLSLYPPLELRAAIAPSWAALPSREVSWIDEHLLVIADKRGNQADPTAQPARRTRQSPARPPRSAPSAPGPSSAHHQGGLRHLAQEQVN